MRKLKLYLDTSTISHLFAYDTPEKMAETNQLWEDFINGKYQLFISPVVTTEINKCSEEKRRKLYAKMEQIHFEVLERTDEITQLAEEYITNGVLTRKSLDDCLHIAFAVVNNCDIIVSWNFKHLTNVRTIDKVKVVNAMNRYREISIVPPTMLLWRGDEHDRE